MSDHVKVPREFIKMFESAYEAICEGHSIGICYDLMRAAKSELKIEASPEPESAEPVAYMRLHSTGLYIKMEHLSETQAKRNHYQSLERLNARGGISPAEALALIERRSYRTTGEFEATKKLLELVSEITKPPKQEQWIPVSEQQPPTDEPVVYMRKGESKISVGIAYWSVSSKWIPESQSVHCPNGFTHWMPLPQPPQE